MPKDELLKLAEDIKQNGQLEDITITSDGQLLDGNSRWDACDLVGVTPQTVTYQGSDPIGFVISKNRHRKHLGKNVLAMTVAQLVKLRPGRPYGITPLDKRNYSSKELAEKAGLSEGRIEKARTIVNHAAPNITAMVEADEVNLHIAAEAVRRVPKETQATWTKDDVKREGRKAINSYPSNQARKAITKKAVSKKEQPRPQSIVFPTAEETGFPINGTMEEKDAHHRKYGRTPLHPKAVKEMLNHEAIVQGYIMAILAVTDEKQPDALTFLASLGAMGGWVPHPEKGKDWGIDFARKARKHLAILHERVPMLVERARELQIMVDNGSGQVQT